MNSFLEFNDLFKEYNGQPYVYMLLVHQLDNLDDPYVFQISLTKKEAEIWVKEFPGKCLKRSYKKILLYKR